MILDESAVLLNDGTDYGKLTIEQSVSKTNEYNARASARKPINNTLHLGEYHTNG